MRVLDNIGQKTYTAPLLLAGVLLVGIVLRIYDIGTESLWLDEGISIFRSRLSPSEMIDRLSLSTQQPVYYLLLHYWVSLFGDTAFSVRFLSAVLGVLAVFMMYKIAKRIFDEKVGLLSAMIMSVSVFHIGYAQEARNYSLMTLLSLISMYYFIELLQRVDWRNAVGYLIPSCLLIYTHYFGFFIITAQNIVLFVMWFFFQERNKSLFRCWILVQVALAASYLPWLATLKAQASLWQKGLAMKWIPVPTLNSVYESFQTYAGSSSLLLLFTCLAILSCVMYQKNNAGEQGKDCRCGKHWPDGMKISLLIAWLFIPVFFPFLLSFLFKPMFVTRFTIPASLSFYILVAKGIQNIRHGIVKVMVIILIVGLSAANIWNYYGKVDKQQWREVASYVDSHAQGGDVILFNPGDPERLIFRYYSKREDLKRKQIPQLDGYDEETVAGLLQELIGGSVRVWLVQSFNKDPQGVVRDILMASGYRIIDQKKYDGNGSLPSWGVIETSLFKKNRGE